MSRLAFIWSVPATACLTLGVMHLVIWIKGRAAKAQLAFACAAFAAAGIAVCEGMLMEAGTAADFVRVTRWIHLPINISLMTELADELPPITGDLVQLQQVLLNLITNACDAMAEIPPSERILKIVTIRHEEAVRISLVDQGCGLPHGDAAQVFQPFFTTKAQGMGVGLSLCQSIIAAHHGRLWATPNPGCGTTFHLELQIIEAVA